MTPKKECLEVIAEGLPRKVALENFMLTELYEKDLEFRREVNRAATSFMMQQIRNAKRLIEEEDKNSARLVMYLLDNSIESLDEIDDTLEVDDADPLTELDVQDMLETYFSVTRKEYDADDKKERTDTNTAGTTNKYH